MNFKLYIEAIYDQSILDAIRDKLDKDKYVVVNLDNNGNIAPDWPVRNEKIARSNYHRQGKVSIDSQNKKIEIKVIGDKINPQSLKIIDLLKKNNIIDNSYKILNSSKFGEYIGNDYKHFQRELDLDNIQSYSPIMDNITLYHGTSEKDWEEIQKKGALLPLFKGSNLGGFESRGKSDYNHNHLYLASSESKAWDYAKSRARGISRKEDEKAWKHMQYSSPCNWPVKPVILQVQIPDMLKLKVDDDIVINKLQNIGRKIWDNKLPEERAKIVQILQKLGKLDRNDESIAYMLWRESRKGFNEIISKFNPRMLKAWYSGLLRSDQVAYNGFIPIKFIKKIDVC